MRAARLGDDLLGGLSGADGREGDRAVVGDGEAVHGRALPPLHPGDVIAVPDTGAYAFAHHYAYNSLPRPAVHGFTVADDGTVSFATVRPGQTPEEIVAEAGGAHADALVR